MVLRDKPPFRADHVGSLLRPPEIFEARARRDKGEVTAEELWEVESQAIRDVVALQEEVGLQSATDGEFRRSQWWVDFVSAIDGVEIRGGLPIKFRRADGEVEHAPPRAVVTGKLARSRGISTEHFRFLHSVTKGTAKQCVPSPSMVHFRGGRGGIDEKAYPDMDEFFADLARVYREEIAELAEIGCRYIQLDEVNFAFLCDPKVRESARQIGEDPDELPHTYARLINDTIRDRPDDMIACMHLCRGNHRSSWVAEGGYEPVAEVLFHEIEIDGYFMEFDSPRAGNFEPLRFVPKGKTVILGLVTTKFAELENKDDLKRRIEEASKYVPLDQLALSPQCGFASTMLGNELDVDREKEKLRLVVEVAEEVWG
jgi:5-methyltetrahydropteroyltriglutamate--homocysteine methyltransferase